MVWISQVIDQDVNVFRGAKLAATSERLDTERKFRERTAGYARAALEADVRADVRLILGAYHQETGDSAEALEALTSPFDGHDPDDNWYIVRKMGYLADLGARDAVVALHAKLTMQPRSLPSELHAPMTPTCGSVGPAISTMSGLPCRGCV